MDDDWDQDHFTKDDLDLSVVSIHICAYENEKNEGDEDGNSPTNHWAIFLEISEKHSVRLDMAPGYGDDGRRGKIQVASKTYQVTAHAIRTLAFETVDGTTVRTITNLISSNKRQKYTFSEEFEGCRFWVFTIISDLEGAGLLNPGSGQLALEAVSYYWRSPDGQEFRDVKQGAFQS